MDEQLREIFIPFKPAATASQSDISVRVSRAGWSVDLRTPNQVGSEGDLQAMLPYLGDRLLDMVYRHMSSELKERKSRARRAAFNKRAKGADGVVCGKLLAGRNLIRWELTWDDVEQLQTAVAGEERANG